MQGLGFRGVGFGGLGFRGLGFFLSAVALSPKAALAGLSLPRMRLTLRAGGALTVKALSFDCDYGEVSHQDLHQRRPSKHVQHKRVHPQHPGVQGLGLGV